MGRREPDEDSPKMVKVAAAADSSSPSSAESSFRELDYVSLQTQTRLWLGEVLGTRLDEHMSVADLLADGEILFDVSRVIWNVFVANHMELIIHLKSYEYEPFASKKKSGRYTPYSNVDSFLKICKILGLTSVDLFSPSDVVEKRNTRKVCMCVRSLSKKARSQHLHVPDFDIVTCNIAMPTDMVECIRRHLELSKHSFSRSASSISYDDSGPNCQSNSIALTAKTYHLFSEESDDSESSISYPNPTYNASLEMDSGLVDSPVSSVGKSYIAEQKLLQVGNWNQGTEEYTRQLELPCLNESAGSNNLQHVGHMCQVDGMSLSSPSSVDSLYHTDGIADVSKRDIAHGHGNSPERSCGTGPGDLLPFDGEESSFGPYASAGSHVSNAMARTFESRFSDKLSDVDDEMSSNASRISVSGTALNLNSDNETDAENDLKSCQSTKLQNQEASLLNKESNNISQNSEKSSFDKKVMEIDFSTELYVPCSDGQTCAATYSDHLILLETKHENHDDKLSLLDSNSNNCHCYDYIEFSSGQPCSSINFHLWDQKGKLKQDSFALVNKPNGSNEDRSCLKSVLEEGAQEEVLLPTLSKRTVDTKFLKEMDSLEENDEKVQGHATTVESQSTNLKNIGDTEHEDLNALPAVVGFERRNSSPMISRIDDVFSSQHHDLVIQDIGDCDSVIMDNSYTLDTTAASPCSSSSMPGRPSPLTAEFSECIYRNNPEISTLHEDLLCSADSMDKDDGKHGKLDTVTFVSSNVKEDVGIEMPKCKSEGKPLLKSFVGGSAVLGVLFLVFQLRRSNGKKTGKTSIGQSDQIGKANGARLSSQKGQKGVRSKGVYPAEKLKL